MNEIFVPIKGYEGLYEISNLGRIKSLCKKGSKKELILKQQCLDLSTGYLGVQLYKNNKILTKRLHRLLAENFIENPNYYKVVNHKDGNKQNNSLNNLEWTTYSLNTLHSYKLGLQKIKKGEELKNCKITENQLKEINFLFKKGFSNKDISKKYNIDSSTVSRYRNKLKRNVGKLEDYSIIKNSTYSKKFTRQDVLNIFDLLLKGASQKDIAKLMNVNISTITDINKGKTYTYIKRPNGIPVVYKKVGKKRIAITNSDIC